MAPFRGILNSNGSKDRIRIFLDIDCMIPYVSDLFIKNIRTDIKVCNNICIIRGTKYLLNIEKFPDEIIVVGREMDNFWYEHFPCLKYIYKKKFFVVTNKEEV